MRSGRRACASLLAAFVLAGCQSMSRPTQVATASAFDPGEAAFIKKSGTAKIEGHAFWRTGEGGTTDAGGEIVRLVPATAYARERFATLYRGGRSINASSIPQVEVDPAYADYTRTTRAESNGRFQFDNVAPGTYFVTTQIVWKDKHQYMHFQYGVYHNIQRVGQDGGSMFETVTVTGKDKETIKLVLTNDR
jgi:hypothetical protein